MENRVKFKIGEIEFEAEGSDEVVERERNVFLNTLLPAAVDAIVRTRGASQAKQYIEAVEQPALFSAVSSTQSNVEDAQTSTNLSRTSLASYLKSYGVLNDQDFVLISAYFDEKKNATPMFSSDNAKQYYADARRIEYSNLSMLLRELARKGLIMDAPNPEKKTPKQYVLTSDGLYYVESYKPKDESTEKKKTSSKPKKARSKVESVYASLSADSLNLKNYPQIKSQDSFIKQMLLALYIVSNEGHGESFSVLDIQYIMTDILGLPATGNQIPGVFKRNKSWFKKEPDPTNKKACKHKILEGAKDFARQIIAENAS